MLPYVLNLCFLFSYIMACLNYSISYSYPLNRFYIEFLRSNMLFSSIYSADSLSKFWLWSGGLISGLNVGLTRLSTMAYQSTSLSQMWDLTSFGPFNPSLFAGFLCKVLLIKSAASILQPSGKSLFFRQIYFEKILSLISFLFLPKYGLFPHINS